LLYRTDNRLPTPPRTAPFWVSAEVLANHTTLELISEWLRLDEAGVASLAIALTRESALGGQTSSAIARSLLEPLERLGHSVLDAIITRWCLLEADYADQGLINTHLPELTNSVVDGLISR
jgi:hypothetical protein